MERIARLDEERREKEAAAEKRKIEAEAEAQRANDWREKVAQTKEALPEEPAEGDPDVATIVFRLPTGNGRI